jgi:response regulator RpfG family c-di-GMP phosphodiesterase
MKRFEARRTLMSTRFWDESKHVLEHFSDRYSKFAYSILKDENSVQLAEAVESFKGELNDFFNRNRYDGYVKKLIADALDESLRSTDKISIQSTMQYRLKHNQPISHKQIELIESYKVDVLHFLNGFMLEPTEAKTIQHPFHDPETLELFLYLHEWMKPHNKAKYSYIFEHIKDYLGKPINETEYFTYVNELTGLGMTLRYQSTASVKAKIEQVKALVRKFRESKG